MKKAIILSILLAIMSNVSLAQVSVGLKLGANYADFKGEDVVNSEAITSFHAGGVVELGLSSRFAIQTELLYSAQGAKSEFNIFDNNITFQNTVDYVQIPVLAKLYPIKGLSLDVGPQFGFNVLSESTFNGDVTQQGWAEDVEFGLVAGLGFKFPSGLFLQGRYNMGLTDVVEGQDIRNSVVSLSFGYNILQGDAMR